MNRIRLLLLFSALIYAVAGFSAEQTNFLVSSNYSMMLSVSVYPKTVPENRTFNVEIILSWKGDRDMDFSAPVLSGTRNCEISGNACEDSSQNTNGLTVHVRKYAYVLKPQGLGQAYFGAVSLRYREKKQEHELMTMDLPVTVVMAEVPRKNTALVILVVILILAAVAAGVWYGLKAVRALRTRKAREKKESEEKLVSLEQRVFPEYNALAGKKGSVRDRDYFENLIRFLKDYLRRKWNIVKKGASDEEFVRAVPEDAEGRAEIRDFLVLAHEVRYANRELTGKDIAALEKMIEEILKSKS